MLTIIENERKNSKKFVSIFQFIRNIQIVLTLHFVFQNLILFEAFSWQKSAFSYFSPNTVLSRNDSNKKSFFIFEIFEIVLIFTFLKTDLNQSLKLTKVISLQFVYLFTILRISVLKKIFKFVLFFHLLIFSIFLIRLFFHFRFHRFWLVLFFRIIFH